MSLAFFEWFGSVAGIAGALMMARNTRASPWAYPVWIAASFSLLAFALAKNHYGLATQQACFTAINALGLYRWLLRPPAVVGQSIHT